MIYEILGLHGHRYADPYRPRPSPHDAKAKNVIVVLCSGAFPGQDVQLWGYRSSAIENVTTYSAWITKL